MADQTQNHDAKAHAPAKAAESNTGGNTAASHTSAPKAADKPAEAPKAAAAPAAAAAKASAPAAAAKKAAPARRAKAAKTAASAKPARKAAAKTTAKAASATTAKTTQAAKSAIRTNTDNLNKGNQTMKNETNKVAERVQAAFGDVNERAKTAMERNTRFAEELTELGRGNVEAMVASTKIVAKGLETVGQEVAEFGRKSFEDASAALKGFADVKSPADFFRLQTEFVRSQFDNTVAETSKLSEKMIKLAGEVAEPIANRATVAAERVRTAVAL
ncbi:MAG TPA: phasin family protein [Allosphingosinicella sp.]|jgi:phasin family protein